MSKATLRTQIHELSVQIAELWDWRTSHNAGPIEEDIARLAEDRKALRKRLTLLERKHG